MFITARELAGEAGIRHAFFTREGGASTGIYASLNGGLGSADDVFARVIAAVDGSRESGAVTG